MLPILCQSNLTSTNYYFGYHYVIYTSLKSILFLLGNCYISFSIVFLVFDKFYPLTNYTKDTFLNCNLTLNSILTVLQLTFKDSFGNFKLTCVFRWSPCTPPWAWSPPNCPRSSSAPPETCRRCSPSCCSPRAGFASCKRVLSDVSRKSVTHQARMKASCNDCWCSKSPGRRTVLKSFSNSEASHRSRTYSLWVRWSFLQAFWYLSLTSSSFLPPRPAATTPDLDALPLG